MMLKSELLKTTDIFLSKTFASFSSLQYLWYKQFLMWYVFNSEALR